MEIKEFIDKQKIELPQTTAEPQEAQSVEYSEKKLAEVFKLIKDVSANNGYTAIAQKTKVARHIVKQMHIEYMNKIGELSAQKALEKAEAKEKEALKNTKETEETNSIKE